VLDTIAQRLQQGKRSATVRHSCWTTENIAKLASKQTNKPMPTKLKAIECLQMSSLQMPSMHAQVLVDFRVW